MALSKKILNQCPRALARFFSSTEPAWTEQNPIKVVHSSTIPEGGYTSSLSDVMKRVSYQDVFDAYRRIRNIVKKTPCDYSPTLSELCNAQIYLKKENLAMTGAYKERGALNKILQLSDEEKARGVITNSAGNHAQAVSYHATRLGVDAIVVMPLTTPHVKVAATRRFGAKVVQHGLSFGEAAEKAFEIAKNEGRTFVHAFNDPAIVAGQGTVGLEILEQNPYLDAVVVPIGGGGLIAGMSLAIKKINPRIKLFGVETKAMPGMYRSVLGGKVVPVPRNKTMADGIAVETIGDVPLDVIKQHVDEIVLVDEDEIASAILTLLEQEKLVVEGSGATPLAAVINKKLDLAGKNVCLVTSGGNIDMTLLSRIIEKGLVKDGRLARVRVTVEDVPGQIAKLTQAIAESRASIRDVEHERAFLVDNVGYTQPTITLETRDHDHIQEVLQAIRRVGFARADVVSPGDH
eukprot:TRINITY_DN27915_c0_g1_i1.p1 TRINITY_DN27915_c0_g1~~TRINITY_DN27915_c0_g1_i1.p1  ORF type:complete len:462 (+),score=154.67 TRINITY_DN27915_c0_g1_i1:81-1466(+)